MGEKWEKISLEVNLLWFAILTQVFLFKYMNLELQL
jgi:hypothetical protein